MIKTSLFSVATALALTAVSSATILNLSGDAQPRTMSGDTIGGGLIRLGTVSGDPASQSLADLEAVFTEFGTANVPDAGFTPNTFSSSTTRGDGDFDGAQVYIWVFNNGTAESSTEHALFSVQDPNAPGEGGNWTYEPHVGNGTDSRTLTVNAVVLGNIDLVTGGSVAGNLLTLAPIIPEPSGALLAGLAGALIAFRRRR